jgi:Fe-S-cluster containining protein
LPFLCIKCGNCCTLGDYKSANKKFVGNPTEEQIEEINKKAKPYIEKYNRILEEGKKDPLAYLTKTKCPFLLADNSCEIYLYRPKGCQKYPKPNLGMNTKEGFCESLDRFRHLQEALKKDYGSKCNGEHFFTYKGEIKPVKMTKNQYDRTAAKLQRAGMTPDELVLFNHLNGR